MKHNKTSYENLQNIEELIPSCREKIEVKINSILGFLWLLITCYWYNSLINSIFKKDGVKNQ